MSIPDKIGRFRIERQIGVGTTGIVYLAWDPSLNRRIAIKLLAPVLEADSEKRKLASFERELRAAGAFSHPNIVVVHDVGLYENRPFIAMEYIEGQSLEEVLGSGKDLPPAKIVDIARQIGGALDHAHAGSVIHRDVKLSNILLSADGVAKLTDFGVAKLPTSDETVAGTTMGTPAFMAPETLVGGEVTGASDQFSLAVVLFEMLTGERPFSGVTPQAVMYRIVNENPASAVACSPELPEAVDTVFSRALGKDADDRYPSCVEMSDALADALGVPVEPGLKPAAAARIRAGFTAPAEPVAPVSKRESSGADTKRLWKRAVAVAAGIALLLAVSGWLALRRPDSPPTDRAGLESAARSVPPISPAGPRYSPDMAGAQAPAVVPPEVPPEDEMPDLVELPGITTARAIRLVTEPPGARIYWNSELLEGVTPLEVMLEPSTEYSLRVERDGYLAAGVKVSLDRLSSDQIGGGVLYFPLRADPAATSSEETAAPGSAEVEVTADRRATSRGPADLVVRLVSEVRRGVLTVYRDQEQVIRASFRFGEVVGPADKGGEPGIEEFAKAIAPGPAELRVYVSARGNPAKMVSMTVDLEAGSRPVLVVRFFEEGSPRLELR